jgi:hypothetical protein
MAYPSATTFGRSRIPARRPSTINLGDVLTQAFAIFAGRWRGCCGAIVMATSVTGIVVTTALFATLGFAWGVAASPWAFLTSGSSIVAIVTICCAEAASFAVAHAAICLMAFQDARHRDVSLDEAFASALSRSRSSIIVKLLYELCRMLGAAVLTVAVSRILPPLHGAMLLDGPRLELGFAAVTIAGVIVMSLFAVAIPVGVVEGLGPLESLWRSVELTKGDRWRVVGILLVLDLSPALVFYLVFYLVRFASTPGHALCVVFVFPLGVQFGAFGQVALGVLYVHLRAAREGVDAEQLASAT